MEHESISKDAVLIRSIDKQCADSNDENFTCEGYFGDLYARREESREMSECCANESPEANVVRYSFWSIM